MASDGRDAELVEHLEQAPEADAVAVFVPGPVRNVGHRRAAGGRADHRAGHGLADVPFLDVDDHPHGEARAVGQHERRALVIGGVGQSFVRQHRRGPQV